MRSFERPPRPPENDTNRQLIIALLAYLANHIKPKKSGDVLLYTPVKVKNPDPMGDITGLSPTDLSEVYKTLRALLDDSLEHTKGNVFEILQKQQPPLQTLSSYSRAWLAASRLAFLPPEDLIEQVKKRVEPLHDENFIGTFGYNKVTRGLNSEVLTLAHSRENEDEGMSRPSLLLGMSVRFEKKNPVEQPLIKGSYTGELTGAGTILAFHIPSSGPVIDRVIEVAGTEYGEPFRTLLTPDEVLVEEPKPNR